MEQERVEVESSIGLAIKQASVALRGAMEAALRPLALTVSQYACLEQLGQRPGISASELARSVFVTRQSMQTLLQGLLDRGLLTRPDSPPAGRALPAELTEAGAALLDQASRVVAQVERRMLAGLPSGHLDRLRADLAACVAALVDPGVPDA
ncbi:MarR family winged helix-turn-helix transcriptional regulator [Nakamurella leprariae]|uniref:MarR family transcriptional regulator n=1 Tax=Nakamurella leprariae TaxID=2803911 RepID=A0A939C3P1_9ACTN|nr:MarR family transcriptional regulator [Nakamurella leprariae]MBM9469287.1 MarR family transcriptional regulator [Nakamurella leprariae]